MLNFVICDDDIRMIEKLSSVIEKVFLNHDYDAKLYSRQLTMINFLNIYHRIMLMLYF